MRTPRDLNTAAAEMIAKRGRQSARGHSRSGGHTVGLKDATDHNAWLIERIARYPRVRDRSIIVGAPDDIVTDSFGDGLRPIREWTERHFSFCGYITGFRRCPARRALAIAR